MITIAPVKKTSISELDGINWDSEAVIRKERLSSGTGSMPNVLSMPAAVRTPQPALSTFSRAASSAEDDTVGALRTRVMNASFGRRKSLSGDTMSIAHKPQSRSGRRMSMPHISANMPSSMMRKVLAAISFRLLYDRINRSRVRERMRACVRSMCARFTLLRRRFRGMDLSTQHLHSLPPPAPLLSRRRCRGAWT
jgi:hypothetical protein